MSGALTIVDVRRVDLNDFKEIYSLSVDVDGTPAVILVGKQETDIGIDVLSGGDIMKFFEIEKEVHTLIRDAISGLR